MIHWYLQILAVTFIALALLGLIAFKFNIGYALLFAAIQTVGGTPLSPLVLLGFLIVGVLAYFYAWVQVNGRFQWRGGWATWLWGNKQDGIVGPGMALNRLNAFYWSALRNSCNNLRFVPGVSATGRPLFYWSKTLPVKTFKIFGHVFSTPAEIYAKAGWMSDGFPAMSAGSGKGF